MNSRQNIIVGTSSQSARMLSALISSSVTVTSSSPGRELPKNFDPNEAEQRLYSWWEAEGHFRPLSSATGEPFVISMPPPNVTGKLHMGHAMFVTLQDIMTRYQRMRGRPTLWLPGTDHAGIATQMVVEKMLAAEGRDRRDMGREAFEKEVWSWKAQYGGFITQQLRRLGASCDWSRERFTLDSGLSGETSVLFVTYMKRAT
jgi:valyl-tRNA synthetase